MDKLRVLASEAGDEELLQCFPEGLVRRWVDQSGPEFFLRRMQQSQKTLEELRVMEKRADTNVLRGFFERSELCVRGCDNHGRPIVWGRHPKNAMAIKPPYTEACLYHMWFSILNCRRRRSPETSAALVYTEYGRKLLDFNYGFAKEFFRLLGGLGTDMINSSPLVFVPNPLFACIGNLAITFCSPIRGNADETLSIRTNREEYLRELEDPDDIPDIFLPTGKRFELNFESSGNWRDLVERKNAFENMTLKDIFLPDPNMFEALRSRVEQEERQLVSSVDQYRLGLARSSGAVSSTLERDDASFIESDIGEGDFLM